MSKRVLIGFFSFLFIGVAQAQAELPELGPIPIFKESVLPQDTAQPIIQETPKKARTLKELFSKKKEPNTETQTEQPPVNAMLPDKKSRGDAPFILMPNATPQVDKLIQKYADGYGVPVELVRRVVKVESNGNPRSRHRNYYGLMQIAPATAQAMGFRGNAEELLDAETNLRYGVKYLRGAYLAADGNQQQAFIYYQKGYYYKAKAKGILEETGFRSGPKSPKTVY